MNDPCFNELKNFEFFQLHDNSEYIKTNLKDLITCLSLINSFINVSYQKINTNKKKLKPDPKNYLIEFKKSDPLYAFTKAEIKHKLKLLYDLRDNNEEACERDFIDTRLKIDQDIIAKAKANYCTLTKQKLKQPVAACRLGFLYNKEPLLKALVEKSLPKQFDHLSSLKDVVTVNIMENDKKISELPFICPITRIEFNGLNKFVLIWNCGCIFSEKIIQEIKNSNPSDKKMLCAVCNKQYHKDDIISLNMTPEQQEFDRKQIVVQKELAQKKKAQKLVDKISSKVNNDGKKEFKEPELLKKIKTIPNMVQAQTNILDKIADPGFQSVKTFENNSSIFKSLFHKEHKVGENLFFNNVRNGLR